jgi:hypothetical protein
MDINQESTAATSPIGGDYPVKLTATIGFEDLRTTTISIPYTESEREQLSQFLNMLCPWGIELDLHILGNDDVSVTLSSNSELGSLIIPLLTENETLADVNTLCRVLSLCSESRLAGIRDELTQGDNDTITQMLIALKNLKERTVTPEKEPQKRETTKAAESSIEHPVPPTPEYIEEKLYSPLDFYIRDAEAVRNGDYDDAEYWRDEISHSEAWMYMDNIELYLRRDRDTFDAKRGLMEYYNKGGSVDEKVFSLVPSVEFKEGKLWCVATLQLTAPLTTEEMAMLKDYWTGQLSDGWGEGIEQHEIKTSRGELYMEPWSSDDSFFVDTSREFNQRLGLVPQVESRTYTLTELINLMEPQAKKDAELTAQACIGLSKFAAELAVSDRPNWLRDAISIRETVDLLSDFWGLEETYPDTDFLRHFDSVMESALRAPFEFESANEKQREAVMYGLARYAHESISVGGLDFSKYISAAQNLMIKVAHRWESVQPLCDILNAGIGSELDTLVHDEPKRAEKSSVLEAIRKSREEAKNNPTVPNEKPQKSREPER